MQQFSTGLRSDGFSSVYKRLLEGCILSQTVCGRALHSLGVDLRVVSRTVRVTVTLSCPGPEIPAATADTTTTRQQLSPARGGFRPVKNLQVRGQRGTCKRQTLVYDIFPPWRKVPESDARSVRGML